MTLYEAQVAIEALLKDKPDGLPEDVLLKEIPGCTIEHLFHLVGEMVLAWDALEDEVPLDQPLTYKLVTT